MTRLLEQNLVYGPNVAQTEFDGLEDFFTPTPLESPGGGRIRDKREPSSSDLVSLEGYRGKPVRLHRMTAQAWQAMVKQARQEGIKSPLLSLLSGYRSVAHQQKLWQRALKRYGSEKEARKWVAKPGGSAHYSGRAVDLYLGKSASSRNVAWLRRQPAYHWLVRNAARYGFYPYQREPWHWEYNPPAQGGHVPKTPQKSSQLDFNLVNAIQRNRYWSKRLGWNVHVDAIVSLLHREPFTPNETLFAKLVYRWQQQNNLGADGIIGPNTWKRMRQFLEVGSATGRSRSAQRRNQRGISQTVVRRIAQYDRLIDRIATAEGVDGNIIRGIIAAESAGRANLVARSGYSGLMQAGKGRDQLDPATSIRTGARKYKNFRDRYLGPRLQRLGINLQAMDKATQVRWVVTAYNAGQVTVLKAVEYAKQAGNIQAWTAPEHYQRALIFTGAYSTRQAAPSCRRRLGKFDLAKVGRERSRWKFRGNWQTASNPPPWPQLRQQLSPGLLCAVEFKHRNLPKYTNRAVTYMNYFDRLSSNSRR